MPFASPERLRDNRRQALNAPLDHAQYLHYSGIMEKSDVISALSALAQETRLDIFRILIQAGNEGRPVGYIGDQLGLPSATLSFHLNQLKQAGLVTFRREGRSLIYSAEFGTMNALMGFLTENCCSGDAAACNIDMPACAPLP